MKIDKRVYLYSAYMSETGMEQKYIQEAFDTNWVVPLSPNINGFEDSLEASVNNMRRQDSHAPLNKRVVALSADTAAVHLALLACSVGSGGGVIVQSFTFCTSSHPVTCLRTIPVFVDSGTDTWNIDLVLLEEAIKGRIVQTDKEPEAIVLVYLCGVLVKIKEITTVADKHAIPIIEDAAEELDSRYDGQVRGTFGWYGVLSFNGNKMITTSSGGALICPNEEAKKKIMSCATQARESYPYYQHKEIGYNYRMPNICAGIGHGQMTVLNERISHHQHICQLYRELLAGVDGVILRESPSSLFDNSYWLNTILFDPDVHVKGEEHTYEAAIRGAVGGTAGVPHTASSQYTESEPNRDVEGMRMTLDAAGIGSHPLWRSTHLQPVYKNNLRYVSGVSESLFKQGLCLPGGPCVADGDVAYVVDTIKTCIEG